LKIEYPDGTIGKVIQDQKFTSEVDYSLVYRLLYLRTDFSVLIIDSDGGFKVIGSNARSAMNEAGLKKLMG